MLQCQDSLGGGEGGWGWWGGVKVKSLKESPQKAAAAPAEQPPEKNNEHLSRRGGEGLGNSISAADTGSRSTKAGTQRPSALCLRLESFSHVQLGRPKSGRLLFQTTDRVDSGRPGRGLFPVTLCVLKLTFTDPQRRTASDPAVAQQTRSCYGLPHPVTSQWH